MDSPPAGAKQRARARIAGNNNSSHGGLKPVATSAEADTQEGGPTRGLPKTRSRLARYYYGIMGENESVTTTRAFQLMDTMECNKTLGWKSFAEDRELPSEYPCALTAFASCIPIERHVAMFYKELVGQGLLKNDAEGAPGGVTFAGMVTALRGWEEWVRCSDFHRKHRGMDLHYVKVRGTTIMEHEIVSTTLTDGDIETIIIFIDDDLSKEGHFCAARSMKQGAMEAMQKLVGKAQQLYAEDAEPTVPKAAEPKRAKGPPSALTPGRINNLAAEMLGMDILEAEAVPESHVPPLPPAMMDIINNLRAEMLGEDILEAEEDDVILDVPEPAETALPLTVENGDIDEEGETSSVVSSDPGSSEPDEEPPRRWSFDLPDHVIREIEFVKTNISAPRFGRRIRGYACAGLLPRGCVGLDDASCENAIGATELHPEVEAKFGFTRRSYYYVQGGIEADPLDARFLTNGQYNPQWMTSMGFENTSYSLEMIGVFDGYVFYELVDPATLLPKRRALKERTCYALGGGTTGAALFKGALFLKVAGVAATVGTVGTVVGPALAVGCMAHAAFPRVIPSAWKMVKGKFREYGLIDEAKVKCYHAQSPLPEGAMDEFAGANRAKWAVVASYAREDLRAPYHSLHVRNADTGADPLKALIGLQHVKQRLEATHGKKGYTIMGKSGRKNCHSCGITPPKKYKWKHRVCNACQVKLEKCGSVSSMGHHIHMNLTVAEGAPGRVHLYSSTLPPKKKKWDKVQVPPGSVTIRVKDAPWEAGVRKMDKTLEVDKEDIFKIDTSLEKQKQECVLAGIGVAGCYPMVTRKGLYSRMQALLGRAFLEKPHSSPAAWKKLEDLKHLILPAGALDGEQMAVEDWIASMPGRRKRALQRAYKEFLNEGGLDDKKDLTFSAFVKQELLASFEEFDGSISKELESTIARMIMAPQDKAHIVAGPIIKPKLMRLKDHWSNQNWLFYGATTPKKCKDGEVFVFWCDFSMFDCTHSEYSMRLIESYYAEMSTDPLFRKVIDAWRVPEGTMGELKFKLRNIMLASGRDDTALMNAMYCGFVMGMAVTAALADKRMEDLSVEDLRSAMAYVRISICGDDTLGFLPKTLWVRRAQIMTNIQLNLERFGLVAKLDCSCFLGSAVYLGMRPYNVPTPTGRRWLWGRTIGRAAYKLGWMLDLSKGDAAAWATGVAESIVLTQPYVPILSDLARRTLFLREGCRRTPVLEDDNKPWTNWTAEEGQGQLTYDDHTLECLVLSYQTPSLFGAEKPVSPLVDDFRRSARAIKDIPCLPYMIADPALQFMCNRDDK